MATSGSKQLVRAGGTVDERLVERAVRELRRLVVGGQIEIVIQVGQYLVENFYGSAAAARSRRPDKAASLARLAERAEEFGMTPSAVRRAVPIALQAEAMGRPLALRLAPTQHRVLLPVAQSEDKRRLAQAAIEGGWTVDRLGREVRRLHKPHAGGRPRRPTVERLLSAAERLFGGAGAAELGEDLGAIDAAQARRMLGSVNKLQAQLERIEKLLLRVR